jgi:hypothetical protein
MTELDSALGEVAELVLLREKPETVKLEGKPRLLTHNAVLETLARVIAIFKNEAFQAEREWRLISTFGYESDTRFRSSSNLLVPYVGVNIKNKSLWEKARIVLSPRSRDNAELKLGAVKMFLKSELTKHGLPTACVDNVRYSKIPFRTTIGG